MQFLLFTLYAPMASFGEIAVGERRMSWATPSRSAILGLVAAARGLDRADDDAHVELEESLYYAVRTDAPGRSLLDYHTAQMPKARRGRSYATRREEMSAEDLNTVLSTREWLSDACFTVCLWEREGSDISLDDLAAALREPQFVLYVGRKSGPLGLPLDPALIVAETFAEAFKERERNPVEREVLDSIRTGNGTAARIAVDHDAVDAATGGRIERRRDSIVNRTRWQFGERLERVIDLAEDLE